MMSKGLQILVAAFLFSVGHGIGIQERIYGGNLAEPGQFPYQALLVKQDTYVNIMYCSGALITPSYILTAASCLMCGAPFDVHLGTTDFMKPSTGEDLTVVDNSSLIPHENYNPKTHENDIGLVRLPVKVKMSDNVKTIDIPPLSWTKIKNNNVDKFDNAVVYVSGFGKSSRFNDHSYNSYQLEYTDLDIPTTSTCVKAVKEVYHLNDTDGIMCAKTPNKGPCSKGEGAPMRLVNTTDSKYVIGIFSWNTGDCGDRYNPAIFTYVGNYIQWIQSHIGS